MGYAKRVLRDRPEKVNYNYLHIGIKEYIPLPTGGFAKHPQPKPEPKKPKLKPKFQLADGIYCDVSQRANAKMVVGFVRIKDTKIVEEFCLISMSTGSAYAERHAVLYALQYDKDADVYTDCKNAMQHMPPRVKYVPRQHNKAHITARRKTKINDSPILSVDYFRSNLYPDQQLISQIYPKR